MSTFYIIYDVSSKLELKGGRKWNKKKDKTIISLTLVFEFHLQWYSFDIMFYGHKLKKIA